MSLKIRNRQNKTDEKFKNENGINKENLIHKTSDKSGARKFSLIETNDS